jgi:Membrane transport protein
MDQLIILKTVSLGMFPLFFTCFVGAFLCHYDLIDINANKKISTAFANLLSPIMCVVYISSSFNLEEFPHTWPLVAGPIVSTFLFSMLGYFYTIGFKSRLDIRAALTLVITFPNYGSVYMMIQGICSPYGPLNNNQYCDESFGYISIFALPITVLFWAYGRPLLQYTKNDAKVQDAELLDNNAQRPKKVSLRSSMVMGLTNLNTLACVAGAILSVIPGFQSVFFDKNSLVYCLADSGLIISNLSIIVMQLMLGANLYFIYGTKSSLTRKTITLVVIAKTVLVPAITFVIVYFLWNLGLFGDDIVIAYVLLMCSSAPTAIVTMVISQITSVCFEEVVQVMFWIYILNIPTMIVWNFLFFLIFNF